MTTQYSRQAIGYMIVTSVIAWLALILQLYISIRNTETNGLTPLRATWNFFSYFTVLTNSLVAICLTTLLFHPGSGPGRLFSKPATLGAITVYIFVVGLTYNLILRFTWAPSGLQKWVDEALHVVVPLLFIIFWILYAPRTRLNWSLPFRWLLYPALYLVYALLRGEFTGFHAYPFINTAILGYGPVMLNAGGMMLVFIVSGLLVVAFNRKAGRKAG